MGGRGGGGGGRRGEVWLVIGEEGEGVGGRRIRESPCPVGCIDFNKQKLNDIAS
jgi:hypothetical protein